MQERRKLEMQQAEEAEAARQARASLLRRNLQKANQKVLLEAERQKAKGSRRPSRGSAGQPLMAAVRCQLPPEDQYSHKIADVSCSASVDQGLSSDDRQLLHEPNCRQQEQSSQQRRLTADHVLMRQGRGRPSSVLKVNRTLCCCLGGQLVANFYGQANTSTCNWSYRMPGVQALPAGPGFCFCSHACIDPQAVLRQLLRRST